MILNIVSGASACLGNRYSAAVTHVVRLCIRNSPPKISCLVSKLPHGVGLVMFYKPFEPSARLGAEICPVYIHSTIIDLLNRLHCKDLCNSQFDNVSSTEKRAGFMLKAFSMYTLPNFFTFLLFSNLYYTPSVPR